MILTVTLNPALDKTYTIPGFALTGIHRVQSMSSVPAGKGLNVSRVLQTLEVPTLATGILGGHTGRQIAAGLKEAGVAHDFVWIRGESRSNALIIDQSQSIHAEIKEPGPKIPQGAWKRLRKKVVHLASQSSWVVFSGSPPPDSSPGVYVQMIKDVQALGVKVALDTRGPWLQEAVKAGPDLVKPNWEEFQELVGPCYSTMQAIGEARRLVNEGVGTVVVSMGAKGALAAHGQQAYLVQQLPPVKVLSAIGSGDTLVAGLLAKLQEGWDFVRAFRFSLAAACSNVSHYGAGVLDPEEAIALEREITVDQAPEQTCGIIHQPH